MQSQCNTLTRYYQFTNINPGIDTSDVTLFISDNIFFKLLTVTRYFTHATLNINACSNLNSAMNIDDNSERRMKKDCGIGNEIFKMLTVIELRNINCNQYILCLQLIFVSGNSKCAGIDQHTLKMSFSSITTYKKYRLNKR